MTSILDSLGLWFADYYVLSAVLLSLILIALRIVRQPVHRLTIVKSALVALALLAGLCALPGWSIVHLITTPQNASPPVPKLAAPPLDTAALKHLVLLSDGQENAEQPPAMPPAVVPIQTKPATSNLSWHATLATIQIAGAFAVLVWLAIGAVAARRLRLSSTAAPPDLQKLLQSLAPPTGVDLKTSSQITVPVALGLFRPTILLPLPLREGPGEGSSLSAELQSPLPTPHSPLASILAHELAHIRNHDLHWLAISRALMILLWSQPFYWLARRRMRLDQESLADAAAAEVSSREQYAEQLVNWARNLGSRPTMRIASAIGLWEGPSQLRQRIALLLDDRFIILRHFSRKLQLVVIFLCALTAAALSLVTLEPAQSKPQEKPANSDNAPSKNEKLNEPDHITIADRFILCPVTTELQRSLLGDVDAPKSNVSLCVFANYGAYEGDTVEPNSAFFAGLTEQLNKLAKRDNRCAIVSVQVGQVSQPFDKVHGRAEQLSKLFTKLARDAGFKKGTWSVTYQGTTLGWSEIAANAEAAAKLAESSVEDSIGDDQVRVFPVRTFLSRMLMQNADCIVNIRPVWHESDRATFIDGFVPSMKRLIPDLKYARRDLMIVRFRYAKDSEHFVRQWGDNFELRKKFGKSFGFANCESQQAQVADEDAKQDKEARTASPAGTAIVKADPVLLPPTLTPNTIAGRAVNEEGVPIANAEVFLFRIKQSTLEQTPIGQKSTDENGIFRFDNVIDIDKEFPNKKFPSNANIGDELLQAVMRSPGRISVWWLEVPQMVAQQGAYHQLPMAPAATLQGHVTGPDGKPVADAVVYITQGSIGHWEGASSSRTDAAGNYKIADAQPFDLGEYQKQMADEKRKMNTFAVKADAQADAVFFIAPDLTVEHTDFATLHTRFEKSPGTKDLQLELPAVLEGRVTFPDGRPAVGAIVGVAASPEEGSQQAAMQRVYRTAATADADGKYRIAKLTGGKYDLWADLPDWVNAGVKNLEATSGKTSTVPDLKLSKGGLVSARLVDARTMQPISLDADAKAMLIAQAMPLRIGGQPVPNQYKLANADGRFETRSIPGKQLIFVGAVEVDGKLEWFGNNSAEVTVLDGQTMTIDIPVTATATVNGRVMLQEDVDRVTASQDSKEALKTLDEQLKKDPDDIRARLNRVEIYTRLGDDAKAATDLEHLLKLKLEPPTNSVVLNNLAFLLATSPDDKLRDGERAVKLAEQAKKLLHTMSPDVLDTLAAACAETGDFECAIRTQKEAIDRAPENRRAEFRQTLKLYEAHKPRRQTRAQNDGPPEKGEGAASPSADQQGKRLSLTRIGESLLATEDGAAETSGQLLIEPRPN